MKVEGTHVGHDSTASDMRHGVLDVLLDESTESGVLEFGSFSVGISRTVVSKLDDLVTEGKANRQDKHGSENGR